MSESHYVEAEFMSDVQQRSELGETGSECSWRLASCCDFSLEEGLKWLGCLRDMSHIAL